ncbi:hypothetical protein MJN76_30655, partial [Salmonella enterica subsp. enterica serovar Anatum]|nr:hypothetical protein [Salmonella enterica subsp. enterica serovar Anatum]
QSQTGDHQLTDTLQAVACDQPVYGYDAGIVRKFGTQRQNQERVEKHIFISNLKYQTLLDSIQGRSPNVALLPLISIPELETWVET